MHYTLVTLWTTLDGTYYSNTANYNNYDDAVGNYHNKFKPMQNDTNVSSFKLIMLNDLGAIVEKCGWTRQTETTEQTEA